MDTVRLKFSNNSSIDFDLTAWSKTTIKKMPVRIKLLCKEQGKEMRDHFKQDAWDLNTSFYMGEVIDQYFKTHDLFTAMKVLMAKQAGVDLVYTDGQCMFTLNRPIFHVYYNKKTDKLFQKTGDQYLDYEKVRSKHIDYLGVL